MEQEYLKQNREELEKQKKQMQEEGMKAMMEGGMFSVLARMGSPPPLPPSAEGEKAAPVAAGGKEKK
jgi:hypothetical protein